MTAITNRKRILTSAMCAILLFSATLGFSGCAVSAKAADLMEGIVPDSVTGKPADDAFISSSADFAIKLFKQTAAADKSSMISPLSVMLALAMTANGASAQTKAEMEATLSGVSLGDLNKYLYSYVNSLPSEEKYRLNIANSIWFRDNQSMINVEKDFLQTNADYYGASAYKSPFNNQTVDDINAWVKRNTAEMIDSIIDSINADSVMYLINALAFEAEWDKVYTKEDISDGSFTAFDGTKRSVKMMYSEESKYIETSSATGFIKNYKDGKYSFVALLPNEGINISDYISSLSGTDFLSAVKNAKDENVLAHMPKFSFDYTVEMNEALKALGIKDAFDGGKADFSKLGSSQAGNIFIGNVLHKTFISVDELGTKAGAVTKVEMSVECAPMGHEISLDRSFVYAIVDNTTGLPLFIGAVLDIAD